MNDIIAFIRARIAEDEALAHGALTGEVSTGSAQDLHGEWHVHTGEEWQWDVVDATGRDVVYLQPGEGGGAVTRQVADHVARHDPARVLAELGLKRQLLAVHRPVQLVGVSRCATCTEPGWPCAVVRHLAACYPNHPESERGWQPTPATVVPDLVAASLAAGRDPVVG